MNNLMEELYRGLTTDLDYFIWEYLKEYQELSDEQIKVILKTVMEQFKLNKYWRLTND